MARLIDADITEKILLERYKALAEEYGHYDHYTTGYGDALDVVEEAPTVDAVPVVRCKDCIRWYEPEGVCLKIYSDGAVSAYAWQDRNADDFCSYGERKTND